MVLGLNHSESRNTVIAFGNQFGITFPLLLDGAQYSLYNQPGQSPFPLDYIIDRNGNVAYFNTEYDPIVMQAIVDSLIDPTSSAHETIENILPGGIEILGNYPNPFNSATNIGFVIPQKGHVTVEAFDLLGRKVGNIYDGELEAGKTTITWDAESETVNGELSSGIYFYKISMQGRSVSGKMIYLK
jgi:hypothetical protein